MRGLVPAPTWTAGNGLGRTPPRWRLDPGFGSVHWKKSLAQLHYRARWQRRCRGREETSHCQPPCCQPSLQKQQRARVVNAPLPLLQHLLPQSRVHKRMKPRGRRWMPDKWKWIWVPHVWWPRIANLVLRVVGSRVRGQPILARLKQRLPVDGLIWRVSTAI